MIETIKGDKLILRCNHASKDFLSHITKYRINGAFTDITLETQDFIENKYSSINLEMCSDESLRALVDYMYNGILEVDQRNVEELLKTGDFLLLEDTRAAILRYLQQTLTNENCIRSLFQGRLYCCNLLVSSALRYLKCHYHSIYEENTSFGKIPYEDMKNLFSHYSSIFIRGDSEPVPVLTQSVLKWNEFNNIPLDQLWLEVLQHLDYDRKYISLLPLYLQSKVVDKPDSTAPKSKRLNQFLIAVAFDEKEIEYLDLDNIDDGWNILTEIPSMRYGLCGASLTTSGNKIYITGGVGSGGIMKPLKRLLIYDLVCNTWSNGPDMIQARRCHGSCIHKSYLYVFGETPPIGKIQSFSYLCSTELSLMCLNNYGDYNHREDWTLDYNNNWIRFEVERLPRDHPGFGRDPRGYILIIGGKQESNGYLPMTEVLLNDETYGNKWASIGELNKARASPGVSSSMKNGTIYVVGGKGSEGSTEILEQGSESWKIISNISLKYPEQEYVSAILNR
ncbi:KLHL23 [Lepeophtheirus salmonis]|uniref:KLHL23 n=1 Tax=Lepeophtheirus salmonis TaxID=72036 RepID=A0A7R8CZU4_LEPSM|nr:KLHL23 [Lepeophtheirus salmonis]CAF2978675.1 KLHL23 [Lepeophtheirus salmonis]